MLALFSNVRVLLCRSVQLSLSFSSLSFFFVMKLEPWIRCPVIYIRRCCDLIIFITYIAGFLFGSELSARLRDLVSFACGVVGVIDVRVLGGGSAYALF